MARKMSFKGVNFEGIRGQVIAENSGMPWKLKLKVIIVCASAVILQVPAEGADSDHLSASLLRRAQRAWLPNRHRLVVVNNRLYRIDSRRRIQWAHDEHQKLFDFVFVEATGLIYVTAGDNNFCILDADSGKELHRVSRNGSAGFGEVKRYGRDQCLVMDNNCGYRDRGFPEMKDGVSVWHGTDLLWHRELPADSSLLVRGRDIYAVYKHRNEIVRLKVQPPRSAASPKD